MTRIAIVGAGYWGTNLARVLSQLGVLYAICDSDEKNLRRVKSSYPNIPVYKNASKLIQSDIEGIVIATPPNTHFKLGMASLMANKHTFIEKPVTTVYGEAVILNEEAKIRNLVLQVGHTFVYNSGIQKIKEYIDSGELGNIKYIDISYCNLGKYQAGGVILDLAAHGLSVADYLLGGVETTDVKVSKANLNSKDLTDWANAVVYYRNGVVLNLSMSWFHPLKVRKFMVIGDKKMTVYDDINEPRIQIIDKSVRLQPSVSSWGNSIANYTVGNIVIPPIQLKEPLKEEMKAFIESIETGKHPIADGEQGKRVTGIMEKLL